ncbi:MAG: hypothetical protein KDD77_05080, partial [Caldilineaceae bacterium]|nr:hypothetical protein [Caldilineaceae bacterium]
MMTLVGMALLGALFGALPGGYSVGAQAQPLADMLPTAGDISADLVQSEDRSRSLGEQASMFSNAGEMTQRLTGWGWQENVFRVYQSTIPTGSGAP